MSKKKIFIFLSILIFSCSKNSSSTKFTCCTDEINGNVNNLQIPDTVDVQIQAFNVITPNGDGINDFLFIRDLFLYPNNNVQIFDNRNRLVFEDSGYLSEQNVFDATGLKEGTYRYKIVIENEEIFLLQGFLCVVTSFPNDFEFGLGCSVWDPIDPLLQ